MSNLLEEITKRFLRRAHPSTRRTSDSELPETILKPDSREHQQLGAYRILKRLGFGGMGHVYLALDTRLGRYVALKFLPPDLSSDRDLLRRLQQEARAASALNHPNILTIYEIGEFEGEYFIVSEFIDGATLRIAMERGAIDAGAAVDVATQVASALLAAHSAGVVHRDLKPGNIMIRSDGYVKVIDFGVAKQISSSAADASREHSATGPDRVVGTVAYMSPEQARGDPVDHRTDIWSLGVILYELLAHRRPFEGATESHTIVAILDHSVPPLPHSKSVPSALSRIVQRALAKDPAKRYQTAAEMLADLHQLSQTSGFTSKIRPVVVARRSAASRNRLAGATILCLLLLAAAIWWWPLGGKARLLGPNWFHIESVRQLTFNGRTTAAVLSPDGRYLAFVVGEPNGEEALLLKQVDSAAEEVKIPPRHINYAGLAFSRDSQYIFETEEDTSLVGKLYAVPILGAPPATPLLLHIDGPVAFSPSGAEFAFVRWIPAAGQTESAIELAQHDGSGRHRLISLPNTAVLNRLAWSPKGDRIAAFLPPNSLAANPDHDLDLIGLNQRESRKPLPGWRLIGQPAWTPDSKTLIVSAASATEGANQAQLRQIAVATGEIRDLTKDLAGYNSVSLSSDGQKLAAVKLETKASLWISAPAHFTNGQSSPAQAEGHPSLAWTDAAHLIVNSNQSGYPNLWLIDLATRNRSAITNEPHVEQNAIPLSGTNSVVFSSNRDGQFHLWRFDPDANRFTQLTSGPSYDDAPSATPDGQWIVYTSWTSNNPQLRKIAATGGPSQPLGDFAAQDPQISPDGQLIACKMQDPNTSQWTVAVIPFNGTGPPHPVPKAQLPMRWAPDGKALTFVLTDSSGTSNIWSVPLDNSPPRQLTDFDDEMVLAFAWSPTGDRLACLRAILGSDVALFNRAKSR